MTEIRVSNYCECPFSIAIELAEKSLSKRSGMQVSPVDGVSETVTHATKMVDDHTDGVRRHDALLLAWRPEHIALFPKFQGVLTVRPRDRGVWMRLQGKYEPPFGLAGKLFDALAGYRIAELTSRRLLEDLIGDVEIRWAVERSKYKVSVGVATGQGQPVPAGRVPPDYE